MIHKKHTTLRNLMIASALGASSISMSQGALIITLTESGGSVNYVLSGTINLGALNEASRWSSAGYNGYVAYNGAIGTGTAATYMFYISAPKWTAYGTGAFGRWTMCSGDTVALATNPALGLPAGYVSGANLSGTGYASGTSFATLGITPGTYVTTLTYGANSDSVTVNALVPEIQSSLLAAAGLGMLAFRRKRRTE